MLRPRVALVVALLMAAGLPGPDAAGGDWPQFRGPGRDGLSAETGLLRAWPAAGPRVIWRRPLGDGFSGIAIVEGRLYTMMAEGDSELAACIDPDTGKEVWRATLGPKFVEQFGDGPRATPTVVGGLVVALSSRGKLFALKAEDGSKVWEVDLVAAFGSKVPTWGFSGSPLVDGDLVIVEGGGAEGKAFQALDKRTGQTKWTSQNGGAGYASGIAVTIGGVRQMIFSRSGGEVVSLLPTGELSWKHAWKPGGIAMPLFVPPNRIFASTVDDAGSILLEVGTESGKVSAREVWSSRAMKNHFSSSVLVGDHIYGFDNATLKCMTAATGEQRWVQRGFGKGTLIAADGLLIVLGDQGALVLVEATPEGYREKGRFQALTGKAWTAPSLSGGRLYLRDQDEIVSLDLSSSAAGAASP